MLTYILRSLNSGNIHFKKLCNLHEIGSIRGRIKDNTCYIININIIDLENRRKKHGSELINIFETVVKHNYNINEIRLSAWENTHQSMYISKFYLHNKYIKSPNEESSYYDDSVNIFKITNFMKKL